MKAETELWRMNENLEEQTAVLTTSMTVAAQAEADHKLARALAGAQAEGKTADKRDADAYLMSVEVRGIKQTVSEFERERLMTAAYRDGIQEICRSIRSELDALEVLNVNERLASGLQH